MFGDGFSNKSKYYKSKYLYLPLCSFTFQRNWFFKNYRNSKRVIIQEIYYNFLEKVKLNIPFFDWFHAYTIKNNIKYPFQEEIIDFKTTNIITIWHLKDGEKVQTELPPKIQYQLPNLRDDKGNLVVAAPFKTKDLNEEQIS